MLLCGYPQFHTGYKKGRDRMLPLPFFSSTGVSCSFVFLFFFHALFVTWEVRNGYRHIKLFSWAKWKAYALWLDSTDLPSRGQDSLSLSFFLFFWCFQFPLSIDHRTVLSQATSYTSSQEDHHQLLLHDVLCAFTKLLYKKQHGRQCWMDGQYFLNTLEDSAKAVNERREGKKKKTGKLKKDSLTFKDQ